MTPPELFDLAEAATRSGINKHTLARGVRSKAWPHHRIGARVMFTVEDLAAIVAMTAVKPNPRIAAGQRPAT